MQIYEKVRWLADIENKTIEQFFSKGKRKQLRKLQEQLDEYGFICKCELLTLETLNEFKVLYIAEIAKKENGIIHDITTRYLPYIDKGILYFLSIRDSDGILVGGGTAAFREGAFLFGFKTTSTEYIFPGDLKIGLGNLLDYMVYDYAISRLHADTISFGRDRNGYGICAAKPTIAMLKLAKGMLPYDFEGNQLIEVDLNNISVETLIFVDKNSEGIFSGALLYVSKEVPIEETNIKYGALLKMHSIQTKILYF